MSRVYILMVVLSLLGSIQSQADSSTIMSVGVCEDGEKYSTKEQLKFGPGSFGDYTTSVLLVVECRENFFTGKKKVAKNKVFDLAWYEDNDHYGVTDTLRNRCELERKRLLQLVVKNEDCIDHSKLIEHHEY